MPLGCLYCELWTLMAFYGPENGPKNGPKMDPIMDPKMDLEDTSEVIFGH